MQNLSEHDILVESQHDFRSGRSCETQLVQLIHDLYENLDGSHACNRSHSGWLGRAMASGRIFVLQASGLSELEGVEVLSLSGKLSPETFGNISEI